MRLTWQAELALSRSQQQQRQSINWHEQREQLEQLEQQSPTDQPAAQVTG